ncbi:Hypothetical protein I595_2395 [Croceitalea dokdonensis DOKDO 023]|uniref:Uncharacterized protein n=1 Tax=Croceitalea dokdonensis DOKDO 023 TaxID=1300341 RepID=A0A0P7A3W4_9FLAO|nr:Hypothetical protein I595_2395 [Croceitalea dokdonensis DOKDO 023]
MLGASQNTIRIAMVSVKIKINADKPRAILQDVTKAKYLDITTY